MLRTLGVLAIALPVSSNYAQTAGPTDAAITDGLPNWAFIWDPNVKVPPPDDQPNSLPGSTASYSWKQARDLFVVPDWHPADHGQMPDIVANGRKPDVRACGACHRAEGTGGPENARLAGLPVSYIVQQIADFKKSDFGKNDNFSYNNNNNTNNNYSNMEYDNHATNESYSAITPVHIAHVDLAPMKIDHAKSNLMVRIDFILPVF